jgi:hypothetical protein
MNSNPNLIAPNRDLKIVSGTPGLLWISGLEMDERIKAGFLPSGRFAVYIALQGRLIDIPEFEGDFAEETRLLRVGLDAQYLVYLSLGQGADPYESIADAFHRFPLPGSLIDVMAGINMPRGLRP